MLTAFTLKDFLLIAALLILFGGAIVLTVSGCISVYFDFKLDYRAKLAKAFGDALNSVTKQRKENAEKAINDLFAELEKHKKHDVE